MLVFIYGNVGKLQWRLKFDQDFQAEVWSRFRCWTLVKILKLDFDLLLKRIESSFFSERNRSDRKGDFALCCSALPRLKPTLQPKRLLPFHFFTGLKFFLKSYEIGLLCSSLKKTSFPLQLQKVCTQRTITFHVCLCSKFVSPWVFVLAFAKTVMKRKEQTPSRVFCVVHLRQLFPTRLEANHVWTGF